MKIVIIPGVGYQDDAETYNAFCKRVVKKLGYGEYEIFRWNHDPCLCHTKSLIEMKKKYDEICNLKSSKRDLKYQSFRQHLIEIILDFEYALKYGETIQVPSADYYIGHSAGSLFAVAQNKPSTIMGSPYALVKCMPQDGLFIKKIEKTNADVLNIINEYDVLSFPVFEGRFQNSYFRGNKLNPFTYLPLTAHSSYWGSSLVVEKVVSHIKKFNHFV